MTETIHDPLLELFDVAEQTQSNKKSVTDPLWLACNEIGKDRGITIVNVDTSKYETIDRRVTAIAQASSFRFRKVSLKGKWWRQDNGPLLAFNKNDGKPYALIFKDEKYFFFDPSIGNIAPLTKDLTQQLDVTAYYFYRPLLGKSLGWRDLFKFAIYSNKTVIIRLVVLQIFIGILGLVIPISMSEILSQAVPAADFNILGQFLLALLVSTIAVGMFEFASALATIRLRYRLESDTQAAVWDRLLRLPLKFFQKYSPGDLVNRASGIDLMQQTITDSTLTTFLSGIFSFLSFFLMFYYSPTLAVFALFFAIILSAVIIGVSLIQLKYERKIAELEGLLDGLLLQFINGIAKLRVSGSEHRVFRLWLSKFSASNRQLYFATNWSINQTIFEIFFLGFASITIFAIVGSNTHAYSLRSFIGFTAAFSQFFAASFGLANVALNFIKVIPEYERVKPVLTTAPELETAGAEPGILTGRIDLKNVYYRYQDQGTLAVEDVSLEIKPGNFVAIVGHTGSGKSTILRLLLGLIAPQSGQILYDGQELATLNLRSVRQQLGVVLQNGVLLPGTILENIAGSRQISLEDAWDAAKKAGLGDVIEAMPMQMHTLLTESGKTLSAGQRQRLMIARALARKPKIILLDEATSALDNTTQAQVMESLEQLQITRVIIAHRLSTIMHADKIYVMEAGRVVEAGDYQSLLAKDGVFAGLAKQQIL